jgi:arabinogalactan oligomer / maltooligosaccharide transport system permease protein
VAAITTPVQGSTPAPGLAKSPGKRLLDGLYPYGYIAPSIAFMVIASLFPIVFTLYISMTDYGTGHIISWNFIGLSNYQSIFDPAGISDFLNVFWWTVTFAAVTTLFCFFLGLVLAYLLNNENMWERNFYRTILIVPWALPGTIAILAWSGILDTNGLVNTFLIKFNIYPITFLADPFWARVSVFIVAFWLGYPFMMTACLGALQSISPEVLQAAEIDGANGLQKFLRVTFPLLRQAALPLVISTFAYNLNNFGAVYLLTSGGPAESVNIGYTDILPTYMYKIAQSLQEFGLACAYGVIIFIIIGTFSAVNMKLSGAFEEVD